MKKLVILLFGDRSSRGLIGGSIYDLKFRWKIFIRELFERGKL